MNIKELEEAKCIVFNECVTDETANNLRVIMKVSQQHLKLLKAIESGELAVVPTTATEEQVWREDVPFHPWRKLECSGCGYSEKVGSSKGEQRRLYEAMIKAAPPLDELLGE